MSRIIFIVGPTAVGKSVTAFLYAKKIGAQIISCDSMLVYKEPSIITSKPNRQMLKDINHHFVDIVSVAQNYNVFDYFKAATDKILELHKKHIPIIVCGGSGLYVKALLDGIFEGIGKDEKLRKVLEEKAASLGSQFLHEELQKVDKQAAEKINPKDTRRIIRALEVYYISGTPISEKRKNTKGLFGTVPVEIFGLRMERSLLYKYIDARVMYMFKEGAIEEVKKIIKLPLSITAEKIIGIKEIKSFLSAEFSLEQAQEEMQKNTRHFAKRQFTWFNADKRIKWVNVDGLDANQICNALMRRIG